MKILVIHRYFWPQAYPYAQMLKGIAETLSTKHSVSVLTTDSGSSEEKDFRSAWSNKQKIDIDTLSLGPEKRASMIKKGLNSLYFGIWLIYKLLQTKADVVMVATTPPVIIVMLVRWTSYFKKFRYVYHCQDIHPEAMLLGGNLKEGFVYNTLRNIDKKNIDKAWKVITLSKDMKKTLGERGCSTSHVKIINNFIFEKSDDAPIQNRNDKVSFLFAGSLGRLQNLSLLMEGLALLKHRNDIQFTFMGDGIMYHDLLQYKEINKLDNVEFLGQQSLSVAVKSMRSSDYGIVSIGNNITRVAYPSKTMMYLGNGLPILALVDQNTELYNFINNKEIGLAIEPTSPKVIAESIALLVNQIKQKPIDKDHIKKIATNNFGKETVLNKFLETFINE